MSAMVKLCVHLRLSGSCEPRNEVLHLGFTINQGTEWGGAVCLLRRVCIVALRHYLMCIRGHISKL